MGLNRLRREGPIHHAQPTQESQLIAKFALAIIVIFAFSVWLGGCGGGSAASDPSDPGTPAGAYALTLTGTSTNTTAQVTLNLTVQ